MEYEAAMRFAGTQAPSLSAMHRFDPEASLSLGCDEGDAALVSQPAHGDAGQPHAGVPPLPLHSLRCDGLRIDSPSANVPGEWPPGNPFDLTPCESWRTPALSHRSQSPAASTVRRQRHSPSAGTPRPVIGLRSPQSRGLDRAAAQLVERFGEDAGGCGESDLALSVRLPDRAAESASLPAAASAVVAELQDVLSSHPAFAGDCAQPREGGREAGNAASPGPKPTSLVIRLHGAGVTACLRVCMESASA
eukprot:TRINITY_DN15228_c0_g1_i4.p1 TRINITY_DN15228_c0_g1~~TRINITY_DN15228_c0_g1_i4.p1  ORF type:complete len:249 (+),score=29.75 TRINITY_DN15228_c0_g1_i4:1332-2078(+)